MSFFEFVSENKKKYLVYAFRYMIMYIVLFVVGTQLALVIYFLVGKTSKLVWFNYGVLLNSGTLVYAMKAIPIATFATTLYAAIAEYGEQRE